jgi:hypothetical protein
MKNKVKKLSLIVLLGIGSALALDNSSQYTSLKNCELLESKPDYAGYFRSLCPGLGRYKIEINRQDDREELTVITPEKRPYPLNFYKLWGNSFSFLGEKVEWRGKVKSGKLLPVAIIVRYSEYNGEIFIPHLIVAKLIPKPCITHDILVSNVQNMEARNAADIAVKTPCMQFR